MIQEAAAVKVQMVVKVKVVMHPQEEEPQEVQVQEEEHPSTRWAARRSNPPGNTPPHQTGGAGFPGGTPQSPPGKTQPNRHPDPWAPLDRSRKSLPKLMLPSNYKSCSILDMRQLLESWYDKSTFAIATWRGDAQRYWLTQVLDCARNGHDQWLHSTPSQRASLEPPKAYSRGTECCGECTPRRVARCDSEVHCRCVHEARILHSRTDSLVCDEAAHSTS